MSSSPNIWCYKDKRKTPNLSHDISNRQIKPYTLDIDGNGNVELTKFSSMAAPEVVKMTTSSAAIDENFVWDDISISVYKSRWFHTEDCPLVRSKQIWHSDNLNPCPDCLFWNTIMLMWVGCLVGKNKPWFGQTVTKWKHTRSGGDLTKFTFW